LSEMPEIIQGKFKVLSNRKMEPDCFKMAILAPRIAITARPGQFVHLRCQEELEPLLRRPFSFHRINGGSFEILYKVIGRGTNLLAKKKKGDTIDTLGPLGNGFNIIRNSKFEIRNSILVAGGMGVAPLLALGERLAGRRNTLVLIGARNKKEVLCENEFKQLGAKVQIATDDGSRGRKGLVTDLLKKVLRNTKYEIRNTIYACGPKPMLKEIARLSSSLGISAYGSLEENMACGVGACLGCAIGTREGYKRVCKDGPVFNLREIKW